MKTVLITGGDGLVGNAIKDVSKNFKNLNCIFVNRNDADLTKEEEVINLFNKHKPQYVIHTAARVGGIGRNLNSPAQQFRDNILMNTHVVHNCYINKVEKLLAFSSTCVFPKSASFIKEDIMHDSPPFDAHSPYAYAKRMLDVQIESYKKQYGNVNYCSIIPGNIFGEYDNFNLDDGHVIPSLLPKCFLSKKYNEKFIIWGDGSALREFLYAKDLALICLKLLDEIDELPQKLIISGENEYSIKGIVELISQVSNNYNVVWDTTKPNGQLKKQTDLSLFRKYFPNFVFSDIKESLKVTYEWLETNYPNVRK
jgi:GDP-L-fucose synthase